MLHGVPRPRPDLDTLPFWEGCREGRLLIPICDACGKARWPPGPMCPYCQETSTRWQPSTGRGVIYSWVVVTHPVDPVLVDQVPYVVALVELPDGVRVVANVVDCDPDQLVGGEAVDLFFEEHAEGLRLPNFRLAQPDQKEDR